MIRITTAILATSSIVIAEETLPNAHVLPTTKAIYELIKKNADLEAKDMKPRQSRSRRKCRDRTLADSRW